MNFCRNCGTELPPNAQFCGACGAPRGAPGTTALGTLVQPDKTNGFAIASLVFGIIGLCGIGSILAVIFGFIARGRIRDSGGTEKGDGLALAGIVLGFAQMALAVVLVAIAIPTFLGARMRAEDRLAESNLRNTVTAAKAIFTGHEDYRDATPATLAQGEPLVLFVGGDTNSTSYRMVSVFSPSPTVFLAATRSDSGRCWWVRDDESIGAPESGTRWNHEDHATRCTAHLIPTAGWSFTPTL